MKELWKKFLELLFSHFWLVVAVMFVVAILDLIGLTLESPIGMGFILAFLYFLAWIIWKTTKSDE